MVAAAWDIEVDWDNDGLFNGTHDDVTTLSRVSPALTATRGRDQARQLSPPVAGVATFDLHNDDSKFDPENSGSVLTGLLLPGRPVRIRAVHSAVTYNVFRGRIDDFMVQRDQESRSVAVSALDGLAYLVGKRITTTIQQGLTTGDIIDLILDEVGWSVSLRNLDQGGTVVPYWWADGEDAFDAAVKVVNSEGPGAALFTDGQGRIIFHDRHHRLLDVLSTTSQATFRDTGVDPKYVDLSYNSGWRDIVNDVSIPTGFGVGEEEELATQEQTVVVDGGGTTDVVFLIDAPSVQFRATFTPAGPKAFQHVTASAVLSGLRVVTVTLSNAHPSLQFTILSVTLFGRKLITGDPATATDATSVTAYGKRSLTVDAPWPSPADADAIADLYLAAYKDPTPLAEVAVHNSSSTNLIEQLEREVSDRVTLVESGGLNADFFVESIRHEVGAGGLVATTTFGVEKITTPLVLESELFILNSGVPGHRLDSGKLAY